MQRIAASKFSCLRHLAGVAIALICLSNLTLAADEDLLTIDNGVVKVGIDRAKGGAITWLSSSTNSKNIVNINDPGRLIQQSYYAGKSLDRTEEGQSKSWSPWSWNPIQGGGVGSWARVEEFRKSDDEQSLYSETIPKLWDMPDEEADARMRQWTAFEPNIPNVVVVKCELICRRKADDRWGAAVARHQEIPACYFTRNFARMESYLGEGKWREEKQLPGPPWGTTIPPRNAMAFFEAGGQGVALFSPSSIGKWNFGPYLIGLSDDPLGHACMHVAPLDRVKLAANSIYRYRYWLIVGEQTSIAKQLDLLWDKYSGQTAWLSDPSADAIR